MSENCTTTIQKTHQSGIREKTISVNCIAASAHFGTQSRFEELTEYLGEGDLLKIRVENNEFPAITYTLREQKVKLLIYC
jgi:TATA-box binding protein (TBP) (component of TFIID and TFIIIB)